MPREQVLRDRKWKLLVLGAGLETSIPPILFRLDEPTQIQERDHRRTSVREVQKLCVPL